MSDLDFSANLEYYRIFCCVGRCRSITAAAEKLCLTQPSVTKSIQRLEEQLGCQLFARTKRGVSFTAAGKLLFERVEPACELIMSAERELESVKSLESGSLSIAATEMGLALYVLPALKNFLADHPNIKVKFRNALTDKTVQMLKSGEVDIAILYSPFEADSSLSARTIDVFHECLIAGSRYSFLSSRENTLEELAEYPFISMPEGSSGKEYMRLCFEKHGLDFTPDIEVTTMELVIQAAASNLGIGTLPHRLMEQRVGGGTLFPVPLREDLPDRKVYAVTNRAFSPGMAARIFLEKYL